MSAKWMESHERLARRRANGRIMTKTPKFSLSLVLFGTALTFANAAFAQEMPKETLKGDKATSGKTELETGTFAAHDEDEDDEEKKVTNLEVSGGGLFLQGNAKTVAATTSGKFRLRRDVHQFTSALAINYARAGKTGTPVETTAENLQGLLRYDYYFAKRWSFFLQTQGRRDRFQGLDLRANFDPGVAFYAVSAKKQRLWLEGGYDLQHDIRRRANVDEAAAAGTPIDKSQTLHNARGFLGYENKLYDVVAFESGLEYLQSVEHSDTYRVIFYAGLKSQVADRLAVATTYTMRFENKPLPGIEKVDSIGAVSLVYTVF